MTENNYRDYEKNFFGEMKRPLEDLNIDIYDEYLYRRAYANSVIENVLSPCYVALIDESLRSRRRLVRYRWWHGLMEKMEHSILSKIFAAASLDEVEIIKEFIADGGDVNAMYDPTRSTLLHFAARTGANAVAEYLFEQPELDPLLKNVYGETAAIVALRSHPEGASFPSRLVDLTCRRVLSYPDA